MVDLMRMVDPHCHCEPHAHSGIHSHPLSHLLRCRSIELLPLAKIVPIIRYPTWVPSGVMDVKHELAHEPESVVRHKFRKLLSYTVTEDGGHFLAFEEPLMLADDLIQFVVKAQDFNREKAERERKKKEKKKKKTEF